MYLLGNTDDTNIPQDSSSTSQKLTHLLIGCLICNELCLVMVPNIGLVPFIYKNKRDDSNYFVSTICRSCIKNNSITKVRKVTTPEHKVRHSTCFQLVSKFYEPNIELLTIYNFSATVALVLTTEEILDDIPKGCTLNSINFSARRIQPFVSSGFF